MAWASHANTAKPSATETGDDPHLVRLNRTLGALTSGRVRAHTDGCEPASPSRGARVCCDDWRSHCGRREHAADVPVPWQEERRLHTGRKHSVCVRGCPKAVLEGSRLIIRSALGSLMLTGNRINANRWTVRAHPYSAGGSGVIVKRTASRWQAWRGHRKIGYAVGPEALEGAAALVSPC